MSIARELIPAYCARYGDTGVPTTAAAPGSSSLASTMLQVHLSCRAAGTGSSDMVTKKVPSEGSSIHNAAADNNGHFLKHDCVRPRKFRTVSPQSKALR